MVDDDGVYYGRVWFFRDVSEAKRAESELFQMATTDSLTGVINRRHFIVCANEELQRALRYERSLSALLIDIDHFKLVNDRHGHAVGDQLLVALTRRLKLSLRQQDILGRLGGEEFCMILPETDLEAALKVAERLCRDVASWEMPIDGGTHHLTISIGVSESRPGERIVDTLLLRADRAMYTAKEEGRNRVASQ